ncbi:fructosamine kinase family protein [Cyanobium sp. HWJ4-Hawea]|uniref:fructosamine kinase family protein n=1 Tax=Cyanobium sp. HWJ4-Hawea TaxID=2823713 RepID=UPI0020CDD614|nr:fructosamine kinase family protein [Cyanobium sp. HWJ4-Hawea]
MALLPKPELAQWLGQQLAAPGPLELAAIAQVGGGSIHRAWRLQLGDGRRFFLKSNDPTALPLLEAEAAGLQALARWAPPPIRVPQPLAMGVADLGAAGDRALLLLPWLDLQSARPGENSLGWRAFGAALAELHLASSAAQERFGWPSANFIGAAPQANEWRSDWGVFFRECRLAPQLDWAARQGHRPRGSEQLLEQVPLRLQHAVLPALVHGDLWSGNGALLQNGEAALFDPAVYWGDREVDLAMAKLFGGFSPAFFSGYGEVWPLEAGAGARIELYNLYHLLNHANLFGGGYWGQVQASIDSLLGA